MARSYDVSRRTALKLTGAAASATLLAGCGSSDNGGDGGDGGDGGGGGGGNDAIQIEPGTEILFAGQTSEWTGNAPSAIEGESNPTLALVEGETYTIGWNEGDGAAHNMELRDSDGNVVNGYETPIVSDPGDDQIYEFEATSDIAVYRCNPHASMEGDIVMQ